MKNNSFLKIVEKYSDLSIYGFNIIIKQYANFPRWLPLPSHMQHGWTALSEAAKSELATDKPLMMVFSKRRAKDWREKSKLPVEIMGSPFVHYRHMNQISRSPDPKGTVAFPCHSNADLSAKFNINQYCEQLKKMPKEFHPITVCLFWLDYSDKQSDVYRKFGFNVVTAGSRVNDSLKFVNNYYKILSKHKYATSNEVGSYTFYAVEMDLPFFLLGEIPIMVLKDGRKKDVNVPEKYKITDFDVGKYVTKLFSTGHIQEISAEQRKFVMEEDGTDDCLSSKELNKLLWKYFWKKRFYLGVPLYWLINFVRLMRDVLKPIKI